MALVQSVDFFTPIVDDPYMFGQIAAANALSDLYAMGATPLTALNIVAFPIHKMDISVLRGILRGGIDKLNEAEVTLMGGHSVEDDEIKYGLSVTGIASPQEIVKNEGALPGDLIILTKPLGTGILNTAIKAEMADKKTIDLVQKTMSFLNRKASLVMQDIGVHACTDVTGFGLLGHLSEVMANSNTCARLLTLSIPYFPQALSFAGMGLVPAGAHRNREFRKEEVQFEPPISPEMIDILYDPQTSGGLLIVVSEEKGDELLSALKQEGIKEASIIGEVLEAQGKTKILVENE